MKDIIRDFHHHGPNDKTARLHESITQSFISLATRLEKEVPESREKSLTFTKLEESLFWANAAIAREMSYQGNKE